TMELLDVLKSSIAKRASDLHLVIGQPPMLRVDGSLQAMTEYPPLTADESKRMLYTLLSDAQRTRFEQDWELDFSVSVDNVSRFRVNALVQKNGVEAVFRVISSKIQTPEELD